MKIRKPVHAFLILLPMIVLFAYCIAVTSEFVINERERTKNRLRIDGIEKVLDTLKADFANGIEDYSGRIGSVSDLMAYMLSKSMRYGQYTGRQTFEDGFVVQLVGKNIKYPAGQEQVENLDADMVAGEMTMVPAFIAGSNSKPEENVISSRKIGGNYYYIDVTSNDELLEDIINMIRMRETISEIEKSYGCRLFIVSMPDSSDEPLYFLTPPVFAVDPNLTPEDYGITKEILAKKPSVLSIDGVNTKSYYKLIHFFDLPYMVVILTSENAVDISTVTSVILFTLLTLMTAVCVILWLHWVQIYVRDNELHSSQVTLYKPREVRKRVIAVVTIGSLCIFILAVFFESLSNLNREAKSNRSALNTIMERVQDFSEDVSAFQQDKEKWAIYYLKHIADAFGDNPDLWTAECLERINAIIGSEYLMLFDENGGEIGASNGMIGYSLTETENLKSFSDLLKGIGVLTGKPEEDMITQRNAQMIGISVPYGHENKYGALILSMDVLNTWLDVDNRSFDDFLKDSTPAGNLCVVIDKSNSVVYFSSDPSYVTAILPGIQWNEGDPDDSDLDFYTVDNVHYYGAYDSNEIYVAYYLTDASFVGYRSFLYAFVISIGFAVIVTVVSSFMLGPYTKESFLANVRVQESNRIGDLIESDSLDALFEKNDDDSALNLKNRWNELIPSQKIRLFIQVMLGLLLLLGFIFIRNGSYTHNFGQRSTINFVLFGNWKRGLNLLGLAGSLIVIFAFVVFIYFKSVLLRIFCAVLEPKGETICRLAFSLLQYTAVLGALYLIMGFLGFNTSFQLTSVGIISLAISLGSKDIVADILAGIFIIFEGDFQVGDYVEIDGFTGVVREIGVRSTKVLGLGDNVKIIGNQNVKNVLNMSKMNTWLQLEFKLPSDVPLLEVEKLLESEMPAIGERIPEIISGPYYKGVWMITDFGKKVIHVSCECLERNSRIVRRKVNHEVIVLLESHGYKI